jgi:hypothetical protein
MNPKAKTDIFTLMIIIQSHVCSPPKITTAATAAQSKKVNQVKTKRKVKAVYKLLT